MKAHLQRTNGTILLAHDIYPGQVKQMEERVTAADRVEAQFLASSDNSARVARVKMLKEQVDAGTYIVDSRALALKIQNLPLLRNLPEDEKKDVALTTQGDEPHE